jgi:hypothetical protein
VGKSAGGLQGADVKKNQDPTAAVLGARVKTGRAIAVVLRGPVADPAVVFRGELILHDPKTPGTFQPFHEVMDLPWEKALVGVKKNTAIIEDLAARALESMVGEANKQGVEIRALGLVGGSDIDPVKIGNPHMRAHAAEGRLFREVLERAAGPLHLPCRFFVEDELYERAAADLAVPAARVKKRASDLGATVGSPWRAEEKAAAVAAWLILKKSVTGALA